MGDTATFFASGSFLVNIVLASSLSLLWGLINALQLLTHFPFLNIHWPSNANSYYGALYELANLDMIPTDAIEERFDEEVGVDSDEDEDEDEDSFEASDFLSDLTVEAGYDSSDIVSSNMLTYILLGAGVAIGIILLMMRLCCWKSRRIRSCLIKVHQSIFFNFFLRTTFETVLETSIICMITMHDFDFETGYKLANSSISIASIGGLVVFSLSIPIFLTCKRSQFKTPGFITKYGALIQDLRHENFSTRFFFTFFMVRRLMIAALIVFMTKRPWAQL